MGGIELILILGTVYVFYKIHAIHTELRALREKMDIKKPDSKNDLQMEKLQEENQVLKNRVTNLETIVTSIDKDMLLP